MGRWEGVRDKITNFITQNGSTVIITPRTINTGSYGGYEPTADTEGTAVSTVGISSDYMKSRFGHISGHIKGGNVIIFLKYSETILKDYKITWDSDEYDIEEFKDIKAGNVVICKRLTLNRDID